MVTVWTYISAEIGLRAIKGFLYSAWDRDNMKTIQQPFQTSPPPPAQSPEDGTIEKMLRGGWQPWADTVHLTKNEVDS